MMAGRRSRRLRALVDAPAGQVHRWAGLPDNWREILGVCWLDAHYPAAAMQMRSGWEKDKAELYPDSWWLEYTFALPALVSGLAQAVKRRCRRPAGCGGVPVRRLPDPLHARSAVAGVLAVGLQHAGCQNRRMGYRRRRRGRNDGRRHAGGCASTRCAPELAWTQAWSQRWSTLEEFARCCRLPVPDTADLLAKLVASGAFVAGEPVARSSSATSRRLVSSYTVRAWPAASMRSGRTFSTRRMR